MYLVTLYDEHGAILHQEQFQYQTDAISWMVAHSTGNFTDSLGLKVEPALWELPRKAGAGTLGQPWLKDATKQYHREKRGAT